MSLKELKQRLAALHQETDTLEKQIHAYQLNEHVRTLKHLFKTYGLSVEIQISSRDVAIANATSSLSIIQPISSTMTHHVSVYNKSSGVSTLEFGIGAITQDKDSTTIRYTDKLTRGYLGRVRTFEEYDFFSHGDIDSRIVTDKEKVEMFNRLWDHVATNYELTVDQLQSLLCEFAKQAEMYAGFHNQCYADCDEERRHVNYSKMNLVHKPKKPRISPHE